MGLHSILKASLECKTTNDRVVSHRQTFRKRWADEPDVGLSSQGASGSYNPENELKGNKRLNLEDTQSKLFSSPNTNSKQVYHLFFILTLINSLNFLLIYTMTKFNH